MNSDAPLPERMKLYEALGNPQLLPRVPICARIDGRNFHAFTKHTKRPFSAHLHDMMVATTLALVEHAMATVGYTQSDEISLVWTENPFFEGNPQKMASVLASFASSYFNALPRDPKHGLTYPQPHRVITFDCRVWTVPSVAEAANVLLWRQQDATRNSVQMAARTYFPHGECYELDGKQLQEKLFIEAGINWNDYPTGFKRGTFVKRARSCRAFTPEEIASLPEKHAARRNAELIVERRVLRAIDLDLRKIGDREQALFEAVVAR